MHKPTTTRSKEERRGAEEKADLGDEGTNENGSESVLTSRTNCYYITHLPLAPTAHTRRHTKHVVHNYNLNAVSCCICVVCAYLCDKMMIQTSCGSCSVTKTPKSYPISIQICTFPLDTKIVGLTFELILIV